MSSRSIEVAYEDHPSESLDCRHCHGPGPHLRERFSRPDYEGSWDSDAALHPCDVNDLIDRLEELLRLLKAD